MKVTKKENKGEMAAKLIREGYPVKHIALLLYNDTSQKAQSRVRALISDLKKRNLRNALHLRKSRSKPAVFGSATQVQDGTKMIDEKQAIKVPETVEKGKAGKTVTNWFEEGELARELADECYIKAQQCLETRDFQNACRLMELVSRFLKLSQTARKDTDFEYLKDEVFKLQEKIKSLKEI